MDTQNQTELLVAAREMLSTTKRNIQVIDERIAHLQRARPAVELARDVSSEHRTAFLGAVSDEDQSNGILIGDGSTATSFGFANPKTGIIRVQEDAAFVCTNVLVALSPKPTQIVDTVDSGFPAASCLNPWLRLTDGNTGRNLVSGFTTEPLDLDRGAVPASYFTGARRGLGLNEKNKLFSEFTIPRAGSVRVTVFNMGGDFSALSVFTMRVYVTLLGYKVFGA